MSAWSEAAPASSGYSALSGAAFAVPAGESDSDLPTVPAAVAA